MFGDEPRVGAQAGGTSSARRPGVVVAKVAAVLAAATLAFGAPDPGSSGPGTASAPARSCDTGALLADPAVADLERHAQQDFLARLNELRAAHGLSTLAWNDAITGPAIAWSETMSTQIPPGGSAADPGWLHHARDTGPNDGVEPSQDYVTINSRLVGNWKRLAENVGVGGLRASCDQTELGLNTDRIVAKLHDAFVASPGHYENMVGDFNQVGIGVHLDPDELWVTVRFANGDLPRASAAEAVTSETRAYIDAAYVVFTGRNATNPEKDRWGPVVQRGDRAALTKTLAVTDSWSGVQVNEMYRTVLGRDADSRGRAYWVGQIARGLRLEAAAVEFFGSAEYYNAAGGNDHAYVTSVYDDLLGRNPDANGLAYWTRLLAEGRLSRAGVADNFYASIESRRDRATRIHRSVMDAEPTAMARDQWADRLAAVGDVQLAAEMAASQGFYERAIR